MKNWNIIFFSFIFGALITSCDNNRLDVDVSGIPVKISVQRYERDIFAIQPDQLEDQLPSLQSKYPNMITPELLSPRSMRAMKYWLADPGIQELYQKTQTVFPQSTEMETELVSLYQHLRFYYPEASIPSFFTYVSGVDYPNFFLIKGDQVILSLDMFLGADYSIYKKMGIHQYQSKSMTPAHIGSKLSKEIARQYVSEPDFDADLLDWMVYYGKVQYFTDAMLPAIAPHIRFEYTPSELKWCEERIEQLWYHLASKELLYTKDHMEIKKYVEEAPFISSKEKESPGKAGIYIGWKIVSNYMDRYPEVSFQDLMKETDSRKILKLSKIKF